MNRYVVAAAVMLAFGLSALFSYLPEASAIPLTIAGAKPYTAIVLAIGVDALRAQLQTVTASAAAKLAEMKDGLAAEAARKIELDHAGLLADVRTVTEAVAVAEAADKTTPPDNKVKSWAAGFYATASTTGLDLAALNEIVAKADTHELAKDALIVAMTKRNENKPGPSATVIADARDKFTEGATKALIMKVGTGLAGGELNEFSSLTMRELARMSLQHAGIKIVTHDPMVMIGAAFRPTMAGGMHSTSDFVNILANVASKSMLKGWDEAEETFQKWTGEGNLPDFKITTRVDLGMFPALAKVEEGAEYSFASVSDRKVQVALATYGKKFAITRQAIINDDLNAFSKVPQKMGRAAKRTIGDLVYALITGNIVMPDGVALFHATHVNYEAGAGTALGVDSLDAGRMAMAKQKDPDAIATALNIRPKHLLVPVALEGKAKQLVNSATEPGQSNPSLSNRVAGLAEVTSDARLDVNSVKAWYLAASQSQHDTVEVSYLNGIKVPTLEQKEGWDIDGVEHKVRIDAGVTALDFRTLYKAKGEA